MPPTSGPVAVVFALVRRESCWGCKSFLAGSASACVLLTDEVAAVPLGLADVRVHLHMHLLDEPLVAGDELDSRRAGAAAVGMGSAWVAPVLVVGSQVPVQVSYLGEDFGAAIPRAHDIWHRLSALSDVSLVRLGPGTLGRAAAGTGAGPEAEAFPR